MANAFMIHGALEDPVVACEEAMMWIECVQAVCDQNLDAPVG